MNEDMRRADVNPSVYTENEITLEDRFRTVCKQRDKLVAIQRDLLDACRTVSQGWEGEQGSEYLDAMLSKVRAAIAKAEGKQP